MSDHTDHSGATTELDSSVDALVDQIAAPAPAAAAVDAPAIADPPSAAADASSADALLSELSSEIEDQAPGTLPTPPEPPEPAAPAVAVAAPPVPTSEDIASVAADVDADLEGFEAPNAMEIAPLPKAPVAAPVSEVARPGPEIRTLDAALAARAERSLMGDPLPSAAEAKAEPAPAAPPASKPEPQPAAAAAPVAPIAPAKPEAKAEPIIVASPAEPEAQAHAEHLRGSFLASLLAPLRPIAAIHEKLGEPTRQLIGYAAVITLFAAACIWTLPRFMHAGTPDPTTAPTEFYDANTPAHGVTAPVKHVEAEKAGEHGEEAGHGEAKKESHAKPKPEKKSSSKSKKAPPAEHGEH